MTEASLLLIPSSVSRTQSSFAPTSPLKLASTRSPVALSLLKLTGASIWQWDPLPSSLSLPALDSHDPTLSRLVPTSLTSPAPPKCKLLFLLHTFYMSWPSLLSSGLHAQASTTHASVIISILTILRHGCLSPAPLYCLQETSNSTGSEQNSSSYLQF